jgi:hypothetical protein
MKRSQKLFTTIVVLALLSVLVTPVMANPIIVTGERIDLLADYPIVEYPANTEFWILHLTRLEAPGDTPIAAGHMGFNLQIDGVYVELYRDVTGPSSAKDGRPNTVASGSVFIFPEGLPAGEHTFTGRWYAACITEGGPCEHPMDPVEIGTVELTITFYEP